MYLLQASRIALLDFLPKGGVVAEIGVAEGEFSRFILDRTIPRQLHLIDPWQFQDVANYADDPNNLDQTTADDRFNAVKAKFSAETAAGQVTVHRDYSVQAAAQFPDGWFDWVFIDSQFGVVPAVNDFVRESGYPFCFLTAEYFPTYLLAKAPDSDRYQEILANVLRHMPVACEINNAENLPYRQLEAYFSDGGVKIFFRFG